MKYPVMGLGTIGKTVALLVKKLLEYYNRDSIPMVSFDSDNSVAVDMPFRDNHQINLSIDGIDVAESMKSGKYPLAGFNDLSLLKSQKLTSAMGLEPGMGNLSAMVHLPEIRAAVTKLVEMSSYGGELTFIRIHSSFGGTSRGIADKINEILYDISRSSGLRIQIMDIVVIPGLGTASSNFHPIYQRNTYAYIKEISALKAGRFHRILSDDSGNPCGERHEFLSHTLVLVNDTQKEQGMIPLSSLLPTLAKFIEQLTREEVSARFLGVSSDLERHETNVPHADSVGLFSLYVPNREEKTARQLEVSIAAHTRIIEENADCETLANVLVKDMGFYSREVEQLKVWKDISQEVYNRMAMNPVDRLRELYLGDAFGYLTEYEGLKGAIAAVDTETIGARIFDNLMKRDAFDQPIKALRKHCPPGQIRSVLNHALALLEKEREDLKASVHGEDAGINHVIDDYEGNANGAFQVFSSTKRRKRKAALGEVKGNILSAVQLMVKAACLRAFYTALSMLVDAIGSGEIKRWQEAEKESQEMLQVLTELRDDQIAYYNSLRNGYCRGNSLRLEQQVKTDVPDNLGQLLTTGIRSAIQKVYGKPFGVKKNEIQSVILMRMGISVQHNDVPLTRITQPDFTYALRSAVPLLMVETTSQTYRRAVFCLSPSGNSQGMMETAIADTGIHSDREIFVRARGVNDELTLIMYDKGVPLGSVRALQECRRQYDRDSERYKGHLEPLYAFLPDPVVALNPRIYLLMGTVCGCVRESGTGYVYLDLEGVSHNVSESFFSRYDYAVEIAGRFISSLKKLGFGPAIRYIENETSKEAAELLSDLERYAAMYENRL